jgi:hypothetical protein
LISDWFELRDDWVIILRGWWWWMEVHELDLDSNQFEKFRMQKKGDGGDLDVGCVDVELCTAEASCGFGL